MPDPLAEPVGVDRRALELVLETAGVYLHDLASRPAVSPLSGADGVSSLPPLRERGIGSVAAISALAAAGSASCTVTTGPRFLDFVIGGATPAATAADWLVALFDQNAAGPGSSSFATELETVVLRRLVDIIELPPPWSGVVTTSAMSATLTGLACATRVWGLANGVDVAEQGLSGLPRMPVFASPLVHPTVRKALQLLGHGRTCIQEWSGSTSASELDDVRRRLDRVSSPAVLIATAGDANTGSFDPIAKLAEVARERGAWLHVDAALGLGAALSPRLRHLVSGMEDARSIAADAHKWMNVPYDCGFALLREPDELEPTFGMPAAAYLPSDGFRGYAVRGPESSRRARSLPLWATLAAYGAEGLRSMVERLDDATQHLGDRIERDVRLELACEPTWAVVCFRPSDDGATGDAQNRSTVRLVDSLRADGRFAVGLTTVKDRLAARVALVNWRLTIATIDEFVGVVHECLENAESVGRDPTSGATC